MWCETIFSMQLYWRIKWHIYISYISHAKKKHKKKEEKKILIWVFFYIIYKIAWFFDCWKVTDMKFYV